ncbi:MAG TPA: hypothetical protein VNJ08_16820 [Bacteriovoracaceae bacterium]|nr:hypothetical protein [Bacteriovoracaceae bacterium]
MSNKTVDKKVLKKTARKVGFGTNKAPKDVGLKDQYFIIREDIMKLREDVVKGYDMTRDWLDKNSTVRGFLAKAK